MKTFWASLFLVFLLAVPVRAMPDYSVYTETVQTLFHILESGAASREEDPEESLDEAKGTNSPAEKTAEQGKEDGTDGKGANKGVYRIAPLPEAYKGSILERLQKESTVSLDRMTDGIDNFSTGVYNFITKGLIGISPILLIIGAIMLITSKGRAVGAVLFVAFGLFVIFNAPELIKAFFVFIMSFFR